MFRLRVSVWRRKKVILTNLVMFAVAFGVYLGKEFLLWEVKAHDKDLPSPIVNWGLVETPVEPVEQSAVRLESLERREIKIGEEDKTIERLLQRFKNGGNEVELTVKSNESSFTLPEEWLTLYFPSMGEETKIKVNFYNSRSGKDLVESKVLPNLLFSLESEDKLEGKIAASIDLSKVLSEELFILGVKPKVIVVGTDMNGQGKNSYEEYTDYVYDRDGKKLWMEVKTGLEYSVSFNIPTGEVEPWKLTPNLGSVSLFRLSSSYQYNFILPSDNAPNLSLVYNMTGGGDSTNIGGGWSFNDLPKIMLKAHLSPGSYTASNVYTLSLGGQLELIYKHTVNEADIFVPEDNPLIRVVRCKVGRPCNGWELPVSAWSETLIKHAGGNCHIGTVNMVPKDQYYWQVWLADGTRYVFGIDRTSTKYMNLRRMPDWTYYVTWYLKRVYSPGRENVSSDKYSTEYEYVEMGSVGMDGELDGQPCAGRGSDAENEARLVRIRYGNSYGTIPRQYEVELQYSEPRTTGKLLVVQANVHTTNLGKLPMKRWELVYERAAEAAILQLRRIRVMGYDNGWQVLPGPRFHYGVDYEGQGFKVYNWPIYLQLFVANYMRRIETGYGSEERYEYGDLLSPHSHGWRDLYVTRRWVSDGMGGQSVEIYTPHNACYNIEGALCYYRETPYRSLVGFGRVDKQVRSGSTTGELLSSDESYMMLDRRFLGKVYDTKVKDQNGIVLSSSRVWWGIQEPAPGQPAGTRLVWKAAEDNFPMGDLAYNSDNSPVAGNLMTRVNYRVDSYGLTIAEFYLGYWYRQGDERSIHRGYAQNWGDWIVSKMAWENVFEGISENVNNSQLRTQTIIYYDNNTSYTAPPSKGAVTKREKGNKNINLVEEESYQYDQHGNLTKIVDTGGRTTSATIDANSGKIVSLVDPLGYRMQYYYYGINDPLPSGRWILFGVPSRIVDQNGNESRILYDAWGRVAGVVEPGDSEANPTKLYSYSDAGKESITAPLRVEELQRETSNCGGCLHSVFKFYDGLGRLVQVRSETLDNQQQAVVNFVYDGLGREKIVFEAELEGFSREFHRPNGWDARPRTEKRYDMLGRLVSNILPSGVEIRKLYGRNGVSEAWVQTIDPYNARKFSIYDGLGRNVAIGDKDRTDTTVGVVRFSYDLDNVTRVVDHIGNETVIEYDALGRKTRMRDSSVGERVYEYDRVGNLVKVTDERGMITEYRYDALNRVTHKYVNSGGGLTLDSTWHYDQPVNGRSQRGYLNESRKYNNGQLEFSVMNEYDFRGRQISETVVYGNRTFKTEMSYDAADRLTTVKYPDGELVRYSFDHAMRPVRVEGANVYVSAVTYNKLGKIRRIEYGNGTRSQFYYYGSNLEYSSEGNKSYGSVRRICVANNSGNCETDASLDGALMKMSYSYDFSGNVTNVWDRGLNENLAFEYDYTGRLTKWYLNGALRESYTYDSMGRMLSRSKLGNFGYSATRPYLVTHLNNNPIAGYDNNGNMITRWDSNLWFTQEWNDINKVSRIYGNGIDIRYRYAADGQLILKRENNSETVYVSKYAEVNFGANGSLSWTKYYYLGGRMIAVRRNGQVFWVHADRLDSSSLVTDVNGQKVNEIRYEPFGEVRYFWGSEITDRKFTGQREEKNARLYDYNARMYSPLLARFISPDKIIPGKMDVQSYNRYAYVKNNPVNSVDPSGHEPKQPSSCGISGGDQIIEETGVKGQRTTTTPCKEYERVAEKYGEEAFGEKLLEIKCEQGDYFCLIFKLYQTDLGKLLILQLGWETIFNINFKEDGVYPGAMSINHTIYMTTLNDEAERISLFAHELFHVLQRKQDNKWVNELAVYAALPFGGQALAKVKNFTSLQWEREAYWYQAALYVELSEKWAGGQAPLTGHFRGMMEKLNSDNLHEVANALNGYNPKLHPYLPQILSKGKTNDHVMTRLRSGRTPNYDYVDLTLEGTEGM